MGLTIAILVIPFAVGLIVAQNTYTRTTAAAAVAESLRDRAAGGALVHCEERPGAWPPRRRRGRQRHRRVRRGPPRVFAYDRQLVPARSDAPALDASWRTRIAEEGFAHVVLEGEQPRLRVAAQVADEGPCAIFMLERPMHRPAAMWPALIIAALAVLMATLAAGPIVRRIRRLTEVVRAARSGGAIPADDSGDEIGELTRAFAADRQTLRSQMDSLRDRDERLRAFIANTTHDVMIPLTVLQGHLVKLGKRLDKSVGADSGESAIAALALEESDYLGALMRNLSAAARLEDDRRPLERVPADLGMLVERVVARHRPIADQRGIALDHAVPEPPLIVHADLTLLEQLISNLVHNAVRYNDEGGHVAVVLETIEGRFRLQVLDDGSGVSDAELGQLGQRRFRGDEARTRQTVGSGLGLSIATDVAKRHGFELDFAHNEPKGLRATLGGAVPD